MALASKARVSGGIQKMLKIVIDERTSGTPTLELEGRVIGPWVEELRRSCDEVLATSAKLTLDFSDVSFVDRDGVELLRSLRNKDVALLNCSPFVAEQLKT
jgi:anti-anti-sigma regulatory factor